MKLLFISHETTRTGAPLVLLYFLRWLRLNKQEVKVSVLSLKGGDLTQEFIASCDNFYNYEALMKPDKLTYTQRILVKLKLKKITNKHKELFNTLRNENFDVVYTNTIKTIPFGNRIKTLLPKIKYIAHIHELNVIINHLLPNIREYVCEIDSIIVPSELVKQNLISSWNISHGKINCVYECAQLNLSSIEKLSQESTFHIGGSGTVHWRKGYDVFIQVARYLNGHYPDKKITFTWVGKLYELERLIIEEDLRKLKLNTIVNFIGEVDDPVTIYNKFDVFLMTSREDPFPLVSIEVGMLGKPIISFENATGTNEIIEKGGGFIVPYLDVEAMAEKVIYYIDNPENQLEHGQINRKEFSRFTPEEICPQLFEIIENHAL